MIKKIIKYVLNDFKSNYKFYIILLLFTSLFFIKLDYVVDSPGGLDNLDDLIKVENGYDSKGSINLTYVTSRDGIIPIILLSYVIPSWDLEPLDNLRYEKESSDDIFEREKVYLQETSYDAIIAAFEEANLQYKVNKINVTVTHVFDIADTNLKTGDIINSIDGKEVVDYNGLGDIISGYNENDTINIKVTRKNKEVDCYAKLKKEKDRVIIGVTLAEIKEITTNPKVEYKFRKRESGSSRGLMCALEIYNKITEKDITKGKVIAGTGTINSEGKVGAIAGVKYKLIGAVKKKADIFIVPSENYEEAIKLKEENNYKIKIIKADTLHNVIEELDK